MRPEAWERAAAAISASNLGDKRALLEVAAESEGDGGETVIALAAVAKVVLRNFAAVTDADPVQLLRDVLLVLAEEAEDNRPPE